MINNTYIVHIYMQIIKDLLNMKEKGRLVRLEQVPSYKRLTLTH